MGEFIFFVKLVITHYFNGVMGWVLNFVGLVSLFVSIKFPVLPLWVGVLVLVTNAFLAAYLAWREEARRANAANTELQKIKDSTPLYVINVGDIKKYTIQNIIDTESNKISELETKIEKSKKPVILPADNSPLSSFSSSLQMIKQLQTSVLPAMRSLGYESDDEKLSRLKKHYSRLVEYEKKLQHLYQISLSIESTRHDKNVEVEIESADTFAMTVEDDYESDNLPKQDNRSDYWALSSISARPVAIAGKYYLESSAKNNKAISELAYINASRPTNIFDSTFYVHSKSDKAKLIIKVRSTKLTEPQIIEKTVDLTHIPVMEISNGSSIDEKE